MIGVGGGDVVVVAVVATALRREALAADSARWRLKFVSNCCVIISDLALNIRE